MIIEFLPTAFGGGCRGETPSALPGTCHKCEGVSGMITEFLTAAFGGGC
jgi:hypothetical protein